MAETPETPTDMLGSSFLNSKKSSQIKIYWTQIVACQCFFLQKNWVSQQYTQLTPVASGEEEKHPLAIT